MRTRAASAGVYGNSSTRQSVAVPVHTAGSSAGQEALGSFRPAVMIMKGWEGSERDPGNSEGVVASPFSIFVFIR